MDSGKALANIANKEMRHRHQ